MWIPDRRVAFASRPGICLLRVRPPESALPELMDDRYQMETALFIVGFHLEDLRLDLHSSCRAPRPASAGLSRRCNDSSTSLLLAVPAGRGRFNDSASCLGPARASMLEPGREQETMRARDQREQDPLQFSHDHGDKDSLTEVRRDGTVLQGGEIAECSDANPFVTKRLLVTDRRPAHRESRSGAGRGAGKPAADGAQRPANCGPRLLVRPWR